LAPPTEKVPLGHGIGTPKGQYDPGGHELQASNPLLHVHTLPPPNGHDIHELLALDDEYDPDGQDIGTPFGQYDPGGHGAQVVDPTLVVHVCPFMDGHDPPGHVTHILPVLNIVQMDIDWYKFLPN
jgi:hypothetical protein